MKFTLKFLVVAGLSAGLAQGAVINAGTSGDGGVVLAGNARGIFDVAGELIPVGSGFAAVGFFSTMPNFATDAPADIASAFTRLGNAAQFGVDVGGGNQAPGLFSLAASGAITPGSEFIGQGAMLVIGNGGSIGDSTNLMVVDGGFTFEADNPLFTGDIFLQPADANQKAVVFGSNYDGSGTAFITAFPNGTAATNSYQMGLLVPEPSIALLGGLGLLGLIRRRR